MHIAVDMGHTPACPGAHGLLDELAEDRVIGDRLISELESRGHRVTNVTAPDDYVYPDEINYRVQVANASSADLLVSIHLNAGGGTGTEVYYYPGDSIGYNYAATVSNKLAATLGIRDRGAKARGDLGVISNTTMTAILVEVCFVDNQTDLDAYTGKSWSEVASAIADGLVGEKESAPAAVQDAAGWHQDDTGWWYVNADGTYTINDWQTIEDVAYCFDDHGYMITGWMQDDGGWYYFRETPPTGALSFFIKTY